MIRLAFLIAGLVLLLHLIVQIGPHHIASSILRLGWSVIWVMLIYSASEMIRTVALWKSLPEGKSQPYFTMLGTRLNSLQQLGRN